MKLGKREIDALTCPSGRRDRMYFDEDLAGFGVRVTSDGAKVFLFQYRRGKLLRRLRLGRYGDLTPAQARKLAESARGQVAAGGDPAAERGAAIAADVAAAKEQRRQADADSLTVDKLVELWDAKQLAHRSHRYRAEATRALRTCLPGLLNSPAHSLDVGAVQRALDKIARRRKARSDGKASAPGKGPSAAPALRPDTMARRARAYGSALYGWAMKRGLVAGNPFAGVPQESRDVQRDRVLTDTELAEVWSATGGLGWPWGPYFRVLLLTLQREAEVAGMRWAELAHDFALWQLPASRTKNRKPHIIHLAEPVRAILREAPRMEGSPFVFTTMGRSPVSGFSNAKERLIAAIDKARADAGSEPASEEPWRLHVRIPSDCGQ
jgi:integrase